MANRNKEYYTEELAGITPCTKEEMAELLPKAAAGDKESFNRLVEGNLSRVYEAASFYSGSHARFLDLVQEGNLALMVVLKKLSVYDDKTESTIDSGIRYAMEAYKEQENEAYKAGVELKTKLNVMDEVCVRLAEQYGREATAEEVADVMKMDVDDVKYLMRIALDAVQKEG